MKNISKMSSFTFILLTLIFILLSHHLIVFIHEYAHSIVAWILGYMNSPFDLNYGGTSLSNLLLLSDIDQNVNYGVIYSSGHAGLVALIAFAGPGITILIFFLTSWLIQYRAIKTHPLVIYFLMFCSLWCLCGTYSYVPIRTFTTHGIMVDVLDIEQALHISPWLIYFFGGYFVIYMMWTFFSKNLISIYFNLGIMSTLGRASLMTLCVLIIFGYGGLPGFADHGEISHFISVSSFFAIPGIIFFLWPTRKWVEEKLRI